MYSPARYRWSPPIRGLIATAAAVAVLAWAGHVRAQGGSGGNSGSGGVGTGGSGFPTTSTGNQSTGGSSGGAGGSPGNSPIDIMNNQLNLGNFTAERIQPFVGLSSTNVAHPRSMMGAGSTAGSSGIGGTGGAGGAGGSNRLGGGGAGGATSSSALGGGNALQSMFGSPFGGQFGSPLGGQFGNPFGGNTGFNMGGTNPMSRRGVRAALNYTFTDSGGALTKNLSTDFAGRIARTPQFAKVAGINVTVDNRVATLTGTVATDEQRELVERQLLLEPGVSEVVNRLKVER